jgi:hypothetical protein
MWLSSYVGRTGGPNYYSPNNTLAVFKRLELLEYKLESQEVKQCVYLSNILTSFVGKE